MKKCFITMVLLTLCALVLCVGSAQESMAQPAYTDITRLDCSLDVSGGIAECSANVQPVRSGRTSTLSMSLYRSANGTTWARVKSWSKTAQGILGVYMDESVSVSSGYKYRLSVIATIKDTSGSVLETASKGSQVIYY